jgi:hypothetical protein
MTYAAVPYVMASARIHERRASTNLKTNTITQMQSMPSTKISRRCRKRMNNLIIVVALVEARQLRAST